MHSLGTTTNADGLSKPVLCCAFFTFVSVADLDLAGRVGLKSIAVPPPQVFTFFILITLRLEAPTQSFKSFGKHSTN